jgi:tripartite-type tricarboxylate transporter receptor subunit TctC
MRPAGTPADVVAKLNQAFNAAANDKALQDKFESNLGFTVEPGSPDALAKRTQVETAKWASYVKVAKIEAQ